jgi:hypothetical protein
MAQSIYHQILGVPAPTNTQPEPIVAAFQTWRNGSEIQVSGFYEGQEVSDFIEKHETSNTFATLHTFTDMSQAEDMYEGFMEDIREY